MLLVYNWGYKVEWFAECKQYLEFFQCILPPVYLISKNEHLCIRGLSALHSVNTSEMCSFLENLVNSVIYLGWWNIANDQSPRMVVIPNFFLNNMHLKTSTGYYRIKECLRQESTSGHHLVQSQPEWASWDKFRWVLVISKEGDSTVSWAACS